MVLKNLLLSEAVGDIAGSVYEFHPQKNIGKVDLLNRQSTYTDDTVCTFAVAEAFMEGEDVGGVLAARCNADPHRGYGGQFRQWLATSDRSPYESYGNGSAMRCSAAGFLARSEEECVQLATLSAECTHNHPEGIKGAVATALTVHHLMSGKGKAYIRERILKKYYPGFANLSIDEVYPNYRFDESCQATVPVSLLAFLESRNYVDCLKLNIVMGGDADTMCAIAGPMAYAYYRHIPKALVDMAKSKLPEWMLQVNDKFDAMVSERGCMKEQTEKWKRGIMDSFDENARNDRLTYTPDHINHLNENQVFVFGSNLEGAHMGGAARVAMNKFGAVWGQGVGLQGQSYAIPTMQGGVDTIRPYVDEFIAFALGHPELTFLVTRIGCGIAGFRDEEIAPLFGEALSVDNIVLPRQFVEVLDRLK